MTLGQVFPVFLCADDTMVSKSCTKFESVSKLFDHTAHNHSNYLKRHCFVSIMLCVPVWNQDEDFTEYRTKSEQEVRFELSQGIRSQIFLVTFVENTETHIKSSIPRGVKKKLTENPRIVVRNHEKHNSCALRSALLGTG